MCKRKGSDLIKGRKESGDSDRTGAVSGLIS